MTLSTTGYTVGSNYPLNHARILWNPITGTVTADGTDGDLAANDFTFQRWKAPTGLAAWEINAGAVKEVDTVFVAAHNLSGKTIRAQVGGAARTNLNLWSDQFDNAYWTKTRASVTANATVAPDGSNTAEKLIEDTTAANTHQISRFFSYTSGITYTRSLYVKAGERRRFRFSFPSGAFGLAISIVFDVISGSVTRVDTGATARIDSVGNGWYRCQATATATITSSSNEITCGLCNDAGNASYDGDGVSGLFIWGAQLEEGPTATSYIRTEAATVTSDLHQISPWITPSDNSAIAIMTNNQGNPWQTTKCQIEISDGDAAEIGIIRFGEALQMERPVYGGIMPIGLNRAIETRHAISETGQWLGRTIQRQARRTTMNWQHLSSAWYRANFEPFSLSLPQNPFGLIQNPLRMPESVAWCWTDQPPMPENMGIRDLMTVSLDITGFLE